MIDCVRGTGNASVSGNHAAADPASQLVYVLTDPAEETKPRCLISYLGEPAGNVDDVIVSAAFARRSHGEYPVVIMSQLRPDLIAANEFPIEFIPSLKHLPLPTAEYERYVRRRWSLVLAKWNFATQIDLGEDFDEFLARQRGDGRNLGDYARANEL